jgi:hypothetical protein
VGTMAMSRRGRPASGCGGRAVAPGQKRMRSMLRGSFMILIGTDGSVRRMATASQGPVTRSRSGLPPGSVKPAANAVGIAASAYHESRSRGQ